MCVETSNRTHITQNRLLQAENPYSNKFLFYFFFVRCCVCVCVHLFRQGSRLFFSSSWAHAFALAHTCTSFVPPFDQSKVNESAAAAVTCKNRKCFCFVLVHLRRFVVVRGWIHRQMKMSMSKMETLPIQSIFGKSHTYIVVHRHTRTADRLTHSFDPFLATTRNLPLYNNRTFPSPSPPLAGVRSVNNATQINTLTNLRSRCEQKRKNRNYATLSPYRSQPSFRSSRKKKKTNIRRKVWTKLNYQLTVKSMWWRTRYAHRLANRYTYTHTSDQLAKNRKTSFLLGILINVTSMALYVSQYTILVSARLMALAHSGRSHLPCDPQILYLFAWLLVVVAPLHLFISQWCDEDATAPKRPPVKWIRFCVACRRCATKWLTVSTKKPVVDGNGAAAAEHGISLYRFFRFCRGHFENEWRCFEVDGDECHQRHPVYGTALCCDERCTSAMAKDNNTRLVRPIMSQMPTQHRVLFDIYVTRMYYILWK